MLVMTMSLDLNFRADQNRCVLKTSDGGRRDNANVDSGQRPCSTTTTTTTTTPPPLSCHECDQFVGCSSPEDVGNVTICPETTSHCMVSVNEGTGKVFRRYSCNSYEYRKVPTKIEMMKLEQVILVLK